MTTALGVYTNVIISDRVWWIWCDAGLATVATRPQRSPHSVASNSRPDYFAATRSRSLFLTINECCVSAAAAAIWEIQWRRSTPQLAPVDTGGLRTSANVCERGAYVKLLLGELIRIRSDLANL